MEKYFYIITLYLFYFISCAQEIYKIDYSYTDNNGTSIGSTLYTNDRECVFKIHDNRQRGMIDLPNGEVSFVENDELSKFFYANDSIAFARFLNFNDEIVYSDIYNKKLNWKINPENKKKIGRYDCVEAKLRLNQRSFTVWFTFDVPIKFGPLKLHGLPGLIVEATEDKKFFSITLKGITKTKDLQEFKRFKKYFLDKKKIMNYRDYEKRIIEDEVASQIRVFNFNKEYNLEHGTNVTISSNHAMKVDNYLEYPSNLVSELNKLRP